MSTGASWFALAIMAEGLLERHGVTTAKVEANAKGLTMRLSTGSCDTLVCDVAAGIFREGSDYGGRGRHPSIALMYAFTAACMEVQTEARTMGLVQVEKGK